MTLSLERIIDALPVGFAELEADAKAEGHDHLSRLRAEFAQNPTIFHAIFACHLDGRLAGIGAITDEPGSVKRRYTIRARWGLSMGIIG
jgi:hypothetical protein